MKPLLKTGFLLLLLISSIGQVASQSNELPIQGTEENSFSQMDKFALPLFWQLSTTTPTGINQIRLTRAFRELGYDFYLEKFQNDSSIVGNRWVLESGGKGIVQIKPILENDKYKLVQGLTETEKVKYTLFFQTDSIKSEIPQIKFD